VYLELDTPVAHGTVNLVEKVSDHLIKVQGK